MKLYDMALSGNAHKVRLALSMFELDYESHALSLADNETRSDWFLAINPRGQVPVLVDGDFTVWDSQAILIYLARKYADECWLPLEASALARVMQWMAVAENECIFGMARARAVNLFNRDYDLAQCQGYGHAGLKVLDAHLTGRHWLAADTPTIADLACYPYVALAPEGGIALAGYSNVKQWMGRIQGLPNYVNMAGIDLLG